MTPSYVPCPDCHGYGHGPGNGPYVDSCNLCRGTGEISSEPSQEEYDREIALLMLAGGERMMQPEPAHAAAILRAARVIEMEWDDPQDEDPEAAPGHFEIGDVGFGRY